MTNAEKFEEVFGYKIDEFAENPCGTVEYNICIDHNCDNCPILGFWRKEYKEVKHD